MITTVALISTAAAILAGYVWVILWTRADNRRLKKIRDGYPQAFKTSKVVDIKLDMEYDENSYQ